jgi:hypothetical protein
MSAGAEIATPGPFSNYNRLVGFCIQGSMRWRTTGRKHEKGVVVALPEGIRVRVDCENLMIKQFNDRVAIGLSTKF